MVAPEIDGPERSASSWHVYPRPALQSGETSAAAVLRLMRAGDELVSSGDFRAALAPFEQAQALAIELAPPDIVGVLHERLGGCRRRLGDAQGAIREWRNAAESYAKALSTPSRWLADQTDAARRGPSWPCRQARLVTTSMSQ